MATETKIIEIKIDLLKGLEDIAKLQLAINNLEKAQKANTKAGVDERNEYAAKTVKLKEYRSQLNTLVKESANEIKTTIEKVGHIQKLKAEVSNLTLQYERLTKAELEGTKGATVLNNLKSKREELSSLNQAYGNYSANVGNYSSATKMLGINLGQVMKEMPNFAISARIGIMSLTNNLPMLAESIKAVRVEQQAMIAAGQKAPSMFSLISKSIFGLTGIMSIAMVLMQIYGADIIKWVGTLISGEKAIKQLTNAEMGLNTIQQTLNKAMKDGGGVYETAISDIEKMTVSLKNSKGSKELAKKALDDYNGSLGETFGKAKNVDEALKLITKNEKDYVAAMQNMAFANAFFNQSAEDMTKVVKTATASNAEVLGKGADKYIKDIEDLQKKIKNANDNKTSISEALTNPYSNINRNSYLKDLDAATKAYNDAAKTERERQIAEIQKNQDISLSEATKYYTKYASLVKKNGWTVAKEETDKNKAASKQMVDTYLENIIMMEKLAKTADDLVKKMITPIKDPKIQNWFNESTDIRLKKAEENRQLFLENEKNRLADELEVVRGNIDAEASLKKDQIYAEMSLELSVKNLTEEQITAITLKHARYRADIEREAFSAKLAIAADVADGIAKLFGEESKVGKAAAATAIGIQALQAAYAFGSSAMQYFIGAPLLGIPPNPIMGALAAVQAGLAVANGVASIAKIYAVPEPNTEISSDSKKSTVTEKYHTGKEANSLTPNSQLKSDEIHSTLQIAETVLDPRSSNVFNSILGNIKMLGGSENITKSVGINADAQMQVMEIAFTRALAKQKSPTLDYAQFTSFVNKQVKFEQNTRI